MKTPKDAAEALRAYCDNPDDLLRDGLEAESIDLQADYASRGRRFGALSVDELAEKFKQAIAAYVSDMTNPEKLRELEDVKSEFRLRGIDQALPTLEQHKVMLEYVRRVAEVFLKNQDDPELQELLIEESFWGKFLKTLIDAKSKN